MISSLENTAGPAPSGDPAPATQAPRVSRVLVVDDEIGVRALVSAVIESMGYRAQAVSNGEEAVQAYQSHLEENDGGVCLVIMDLALPGGMSGLETTDALRQMDPSVRVIASSGYLQQNARTAAIERGFAGILPKPFTAERMTSELRWVISRL